MAKTLMNKLFVDITTGLALRKWKVKGGSDNKFLILEKGRLTIKVFANDYKSPTYFVVRYSSIEPEGHLKEKGGV